VIRGNLANFVDVIRPLVFIFAFAVCVGPAWARDERSINDLSKALAALGPDVDPGEAELLSVTAHTTSRSLAREYRIVLNPEFQNFLINIGLRQRGYCAHFARDIGTRLKTLKLKTLVLHWGAAFAGTSGEDNCLVVTARNQPFQDGIILDGWRRAGRLFWCAVREDHEYEVQQHYGHSGITAWKEDVHETAWLQD
jgi:hypothetical protein